MITAVLLNWKRPANVARIVRKMTVGFPVDQIIIWDNNPGDLDRAALSSLGGVTIIESSRDMGLYTRFAAACLARNDCVLIQDDDIELSAGTIRSLHAAWLKDPDILHGLFGRAAKPDGSYAQDIKGDAYAPIVLTRALLAHRRYAARFFDVAPTFAQIQKDGRPFGNGEDIIFSYVTRQASGKLNRVHRIPVYNELPAAGAIHQRDWKAHVAHRTRLMRACETWLAGGHA